MNLSDMSKPVREYDVGCLVYWNVDSDSASGQWIGPMIVVERDLIVGENGARYSLWDSNSAESFFAWSYELAHIDDAEGLDVLDLS